MGGLFVVHCAADRFGAVGCRKQLSSIGTASPPGPRSTEALSRPTIGVSGSGTSSSRQEETAWAPSPPPSATLSAASRPGPVEPRRRSPRRPWRRAVPSEARAPLPGRSRALSSSRWDSGCWVHPVTRAGSGQGEASANPGRPPPSGVRGPSFSLFQEPRHTPGTGRVIHSSASRPLIDERGQSLVLAAGDIDARERDGHGDPGGRRRQNRDRGRPGSGGDRRDRQVVP